MKFCVSCNRLVPYISSEYIELGQVWTVTKCLVCGEVELEEPSHCRFCEEEIEPDMQLCDDCHKRLDEIISSAIKNVESEIHEERFKSYFIAREMILERLGDEEI